MNTRATNIHPPIDYAELTPPPHELVGLLEGRLYSALCGINNGGKSVVLKAIYRQYQHEAVLVPTSRFLFDVDFEGNRGSYARPQSNNLHERQNIDGIHFDPSKLIRGFSDKDRNDAFSICSKLLGLSFTVAQSESRNELSERVILVDGKPLGTSSTGVRLITRLIFDLKDPAFRIAIIDEPELGLAPVLQTRLSRLLRDRESRQSHFPHLSSIISATHSHLILNRDDINGNFYIQRNGKDVKIH